MNVPEGIRESSGAPRDTGPSPVPEGASKPLEGPFALNKTLQKLCADLLSEGKVDLVLGYSRGTLPLRSTPVFARSQAEASRLIFDPTCENNLSVFVPKLKDKRIAVVIKGCDSRALAQYMSERQAERERLYLIGVRCNGVIDRKKVDRFLGPKRLKTGEVVWSGPYENEPAYPKGDREEGRMSSGSSTTSGSSMKPAQLYLTGSDSNGRDWSCKVDFEGFLCESCKKCVSKDPVFADICVGWDGTVKKCVVAGEESGTGDDEGAGVTENLAATTDVDGNCAKDTGKIGTKIEPLFDDVADAEKVSTNERWERFQAMASKCIRCYACRQACPACYCKECFVDRSGPRWIGGSDDESDTMVFHLIRAMHLAGRCVNCGACVRACPMGVDLGLLNRRLERDSFELYGHLPGFDKEGKSLLATFLPDDPNDFIL